MLESDVSSSRTARPYTTCPVSGWPMCSSGTGSWSRHGMGSGRRGRTAPTRRSMAVASTSSSTGSASASGHAGPGAGGAGRLQSHLSQGASSEGAWSGGRRERCAVPARRSSACRAVAVEEVRGGDMVAAAACVVGAAVDGVSVDAALQAYWATELLEAVRLVVLEPMAVVTFSPEAAPHGGPVLALSRSCSPFRLPEALWIPGVWTLLTLPHGYPPVWEGSPLLGSGASPPGSRGPCTTCPARSATLSSSSLSSRTSMATGGWSASAAPWRETAAAGTATATGPMTPRSSARAF